MIVTMPPFSIAGLQRWWLRATLCEVGDCQLLGAEPLTLHAPEAARPGRAYWAIRIREGAFGTVLLDNLCVVLALEAPDDACAGWARSLYLDKRSNLLQREALESLFNGGAGTRFDALAALSGRGMGTQVVSMDWLDTGRRISLRAGRQVEIVADLPERAAPHSSEAPKASRGALWHGRGCARFCGAGERRGLADAPARVGTVFWHGAVAPRRLKRTQEDAVGVPQRNADVSAPGTDPTQS